VVAVLLPGMNLHPMLVHFPIALLTIYALLELVRVKKLLESATWLAIKTIFVVFGSLGALAAVLTGDVAADLIGETALSELHSSFGVATAWIFGVLAVIYLVVFFDRYARLRVSVVLSETSKLRQICKKVIDSAGLVQRSLFMPLVALGGLIMVTITGALGGAIVYGPDIDPAVRFIYSLFF